MRHCFRFHIWIKLCWFYLFVRCANCVSPSQHRIKSAAADSSFILLRCFLIERILSDNDPPDMNHEILSTLYFDTSGSSWTYKSNWMNGSHPCPNGSWYGITCDGVKVTAIEISYNSLHGSLPSQIGLLSNITELRLSSNNITGSIPSQIGQLTKTTNGLYLFDNSLSGSLPSQIGLMVGGSGDFYIYNNFLTNSLPSQIGQLTAQQFNFQIYSNLFSKNLPSQLGQLTALEFLNLASNSLSGTLPSQIGQMTSMAYLFNLYGNQFNGYIPSQLGLLSSLYNFFNLNDNSFSGSLPSQIGLLSKLYGYFDVGQNLLTGSLPSQIGQLTALTSNLLFHNNHFNGSIPSEIGQLSLCQGYLYFSSNDLTGSLPSQIGQLTAFSSYLGIEQNSLTGTLPSQLGQLNLTDNNVYFDHNKFTGSLPSQLGQLTGFYSNLNLNDNSFSGSLPSQIGLLSISNSFINLYNNSFTGSLPSEFGLMTAFVSNFSLYNNQFTGSLPSELGQLTGFVEYFKINDNNFTGSLPSELGQFTNFTNHFDLYNNEFCDNIPSQVSKMLSSVYYYDIESGNDFGTPCCEIMPHIYTCAPTSVPTLVPSPAPTTTFAPTLLPTHSLLPTIVPTSLPSAVPSPLPSTLPTLHPSPLPSAVPTILPSAVPSPVPTAPTPVPTVQCDSGTYFDGASCVTCAIGRYSKFSSPPYPSTCALCPSGRYNTQLNLTHCFTCAAGKLSSPDRTYCADCEAGEYSYNDEECVECELGKYAPQALSDSCLTCAAGSHTNLESKATTCISCDSGTYSSSASYSCEDCEIGKYSSSGATTCSNCQPGFISPSPGASSCIACSAGLFAANDAASNCTTCDVGKYQGSTGQAECVDCEAGKYSNTEAVASCFACSAGKTSQAGSSVCTFADKSYYVLDSTRDNVLSCPHHAECLGGLFSPLPEKGYWVDHSDYRYAGDMYKCTRSTCIGGQNHSTCWTLEGFDATECIDESNLQCDEGADGPLCGSCETNYVYSATSTACESCESNLTFTYIGFAILFLILIAILMLANLSEEHHIKKQLMEIGNYVDGGSLKVVYVTSQIIVSASITLNIKFPSPFSGMLGFMSVFSFDFLSLECLYTDGNVYFRTVYVWCIVPIVIAAFIIVIGIFRVVTHCSSNYMRHLQSQHDLSMDLTSSTNQHIINQHTWMLLFLSYLVLPPVSNKQLQIFDCLSLKSGETYLRADTSISCTSEDYLDFRSLIIVFVIVYQLIPVIWMWLLYRKKDALIPPTSNKDEHISLFIRDNNPDLTSLKFLFIDYTCSKWWFEIADMYRRITFIGILPLVSRQSPTRASFGCFLAILSVVYFSENKPYRVKFTNLVAFVAQISILITFYGALTIETDSLVTFGLNGFKLGLFLLFVNLLIFVLVFWVSFHNFILHRKEQQLIEQKATNFEWAVGFSAEKFRTTCESIWLRSIPATDALVFFYTSTEEANRARRCGIPAQKTFNGIPFTLRQPHSTTKSDILIFNPKKKLNHLNNGSSSCSSFPNEEALVLSLPKKFLEPLPGYEEDEGLCMISTQVLSTFRPSTFIGVLDKQPWLNKQCLLPPHCILRSFVIEDNPDYEEENEIERNNAIVKDESLEGIKDILPLMSIPDFIQEMTIIRLKAKESKLIPLYHYTSRAVAPLILKGGLRMSTQGQGDGGLYFSTQGPASYGLGTAQYEVNVIKDCFGAERIDEYRGKGNLDVVIVYGCTGVLLEQTPGGRDNAKMYSKSSFGRFSLPHSDGNYFLRPDRILGAFVVDHDRLPKLSAQSRLIVRSEKNYDLLSIEKLNELNIKAVSNAVRINKAIMTFNPTQSLVTNESFFEDESERMKRASVGVSKDIVQIANPLKNVLPFPNRTESTSQLNIELVEISNNSKNNNSYTGKNRRKSSSTSFQESSSPRSDFEVRSNRTTSSGGYSEASMRSDSDEELETKTTASSTHFSHHQNQKITSRSRRSSSAVSFSDDEPKSPSTPSKLFGAFPVPTMMRRSSSAGLSDDELKNDIFGIPTRMKRATSAYSEASMRSDSDDEDPNGQRQFDFGGSYV